MLVTSFFLNNFLSLSAYQILNLDNHMHIIVSLMIL